MSVRVMGIIETRGVLREIEEFLSSKKPMQEFCDGVKERILKKTAEGKDYMSRKFKAYSAAYAKRKGSKHVNLRLSGQMLDSIKSEAESPLKGRVWVEGTPHGKIRSDMLANIHTTGTGKQPQREFMNISQAGIKELTKKCFDDPLLELARKARG